MSELGYEEHQPARDEIDALDGPALLVFGTNWCGYCRASHGALEQALADHPQVRVVKVEDGRGRALGRSFGVKLWPTMIGLHDGREVARAVRPRKPEQIAEVLRTAIDPAATGDQERPSSSPGDASPA